MKKIFILTSNISKIGGVQRITVNLANELCKKYNVVIINSGKNTGKNFFKVNSKIKIVYLGVEFEKKINRLKVLKNLLKISINLKKFFLSQTGSHEENTIIGIGIGFSYIISLINLGKIKKIGSQHGAYKNNRILNLIRTNLLKRLNYFITLNSKMYEETYENLKLLNMKIIPNFIPNDIYVEEKIKKNLKVALAAGRFCEDKGFDYLIEIWEKVVKIRPDLKLKIVGDGELKLKILNMIKEKKIERYIEIISATSNMKKEYMGADMYLLSSRREGFGMVLLEAMSVGLPVISFDCPTGPETLIQNDYNGYLVDCYDIESFAEKIIYLFSDDKKYNILSKNALEFSKKYSSDRIIKEWEEII